MSAPKPPDPNKTAAAQAEMNKETAITQGQLGMTNQTTPFGSLTYNQIGYWEDPSSSSGPPQSSNNPFDELLGRKKPSGGGGTPRYEAVQTLSPEMQAIVDRLMGGAGNLAGQIEGNTRTPLSFDHLGQVPGTGDYSADRQRVEDALFSRLNPQIERDRAARETQLYNQGVMPGTEAYREAMAELDRSINDQRTQTVLAGGQEQSRMFRDALTGRQQSIQEMMTERQNPINELAALLSSTQMQQPSFVPTPQPGVNGVDYAGLVNSNYQARAANHGNMLNGLFGIGSVLAKPLGGALFGASDRRLKSAIRRIGTWVLGLPLYEYIIFGQWSRGVMADEVATIMPEAVRWNIDGNHWMVDYGMLARAG